MSSYLSRYMSGEYQPVWRELLELGEQVRETSIYQDALAVARETMRRVRYNIESLIPRLMAAGYRFGYEQLSVDPAFAERQPHQFLEPDAHTADMLRRFEAEIGALPLSLYAWYETIGEVNLVGLVPHAWRPRRLAREAFMRYAGDEPGMLSEATFAFYDDHPNQLESSLTWLDPLQVIPLRDQFDLYTDWLREKEDAAADDASLREPGDLDNLDAFGAFRVEISPDASLKFNQGGLGAYEITVPNTRADALVHNEWHRANFIEYLRICLRWAGLPGFELYQNPPQELSMMTADLLPF